MASKKRKIFIADKDYNLRKMTLSGVEADVQSRLDQTYGKDKVVFKLSFDNIDTYTLTFFRDYGKNYNAPLQLLDSPLERLACRADMLLLFGSKLRDDGHIVDPAEFADERLREQLVITNYVDLAEEFECNPVLAFGMEEHNDRAVFYVRI